MRKISAIVRTQAHSQFLQKKKNIIKNVLTEQQKLQGSDDFQEVLNLYLNKLN